MNQLGFEGENQGRWMEGESDRAVTFALAFSCCTGDDLVLWSRPHVCVVLF